MLVLANMTVKANNARDAFKQLLQSEVTKWGKVKIPK